MMMNCDNDDMKTIDDMTHMGCFYCLFFVLQYMLTLAIREGNTALHFAAERNHAACFEALVNLKANVNAQDRLVPLFVLL